MKTMRALVYDRPGVGSIRDVPMPECGPEDVIIRVASASICKGADRRHHTTGHALGRYPITTGHEYSGYVYQVGEKAKNCKVGDRVVADVSVPCGNCYYCRNELYVHCENMKMVGHGLPGGFAQYVKVQDNTVFQIPDHISFNEASMTEPVACGIHCMDRLAVKYGENVLVFGAGPTGIIIAQLLKHSSANRVICLAPTKFKLDILNEYGIETIQIDRNDPNKHLKIVKEMFPYGVDAIVDATGSAAILPSCFTLLKKRGRLLQFSSTKDDENITINPAYFYRNEIQYYTTYCQCHEFGRAIDALASGKVKVDKLITREYSLEDFFTAIEDVMDHKALKLIIHPNDDLR